MSGINNIILNAPSEQLEKILSPFIREQFPNFVRSDYQKLILFIKTYYEWLEKNGNPSFVTMNLQEAADIDSNLEQFFSHFQSMYLDGFPQTFGVDESGSGLNKKTLLKKIREFYGNKGTESAYRFLFNVLYDSDLEIYYPAADVLRVSDGRWIEPISIKTTSKNAKALFGAKGGNAYQYSGGQISASAFVDSVVQYVFNGLPITEFFLKDIEGDFIPDSSITFIKGNSQWSETTYSVLGEFFVEASGEGYRIGDTVTLFDQSGKGFAAKVKQTGLAGGVKKIEIINSGLNYFASSEGASADFFLLTVFSDEGQKSAKVYGKRSALTRYPGYFSGNRGKLSSNKKIQDGHYYQDFSYELKSRISLETYFDVLRAVVHPSGIKMFGSVLLKQFLTTAPKTSTQATYYDNPIIGEYTPYKTTTTVNLRNNGVTVSGYWLGATGDLYPLGYNPYIGSTAQVGPNGRTTSRGTIFVGGSLGYTWCYVPEDGITAHDPIGAPLGSTASWYANNEISWTPAKMSGLVLWLRPETIGVCGAVVNGASVDVWRDSSSYQNHALPPTWGRFNGSAYSGAGITVDRLRPQMIAASIAGPTGVCFNGGVLYAPTTVWNGASLAQWIQFGNTHGAGTTAERILTGQHLYLKNALNLPDEAEIFVVMRPTVEGYDKGLGLFSSDAGLTSYKRDDTVLYHRSYNPIDRNTALWNSTYYKVLPNDTLLYPSLSPTGLVGFRPSGSRIDVDRTAIAYDPHVSGVCFGTAVGHWTRDETARIRSYLNGSESRNYSLGSGRRIASVSYPNLEDYFVTNGLVMRLDAGNASSYRGSGTIWYDISGNANNATLVGTPQHFTNSGGYFALNGLDQYVSVNLSPTTTMTFLLIYQLDNPASGSPAAAGGNIPGGGWGPLWRQDTQGWRERVFDDELLLIPSSGTYYHIAGPQSSYNIQVFAYSYGGTEAKTYRNGSPVSTVQMDSTVTPSVENTSTYQFGQLAGGSTLTRVKMNIHMVAAYNRVLTSQEIKQTFNSIRERYGL